MKATYKDLHKVLIRLLKALLKVLLKFLIRLPQASLKILRKVLVRLLQARLKVLLKALIRLLKDSGLGLASHWPPAAPATSERKMSRGHREALNVSVSIAFAT